MTTTDIQAYLMYSIDFMEYLDKLVVIFTGDTLVYPKTEEESFSWLGNI